MRIEDFGFVARVRVELVDERTQRLDRSKALRERGVDFTHAVADQFVLGQERASLLRLPSGKRGDQKSILALNVDEEHGAEVVPDCVRGRSVARDRRRNQAAPELVEEAMLGEQFLLDGSDGAFGLAAHWVAITVNSTRRACAVARGVETLRPRHVHLHAEGGGVKKRPRAQRLRESAKIARAAVIRDDARAGARGAP